MFASLDGIKIKTGNANALPVLMVRVTGLEGTQIVLHPITPYFKNRINKPFLYCFFKLTFIAFHNIKDQNKDQKT